MEYDGLPDTNEYAKSHRRKKLRYRILIFLACIVVFSTTYALILPAITMEESVSCGLEEHQHTDECWEMQLVCELDTQTPHVHTDECYEEQQVLVCDLETSDGHVHDESCIQTEKTLICEEDHYHTEACYETTETYICGQEEGEGAHAHGPECYETEQVLVCDIPDLVHEHTEDCYQRVLICGMQEHEHSVSCYADPDADLESESAWENSVSDAALTGIWPDDVIAVARTQLGYKESTRNYIVSKDGEIKGITRYGQWYGDPYGDWSAMFVAFCLHYAGVEDMPLQASCESWIEALSAEGIDLYRPAAEHLPVPGDLVFFDRDGNGEADGVGLVAEVSEDTAGIEAIEGDSAGCVQAVGYDADDPVILGYAALPDSRQTMSEITKTALIFTGDSFETRSDDPVIITLTGYLPEDAEVRAFPVSLETDQQVLCAYDISIWLPDGTLYEPGEDDAVTVSILLPEQDAEALADANVYYVPEDGSLQPVPSEHTENEVVFSADHFSVYALIQVEGILSQEELTQAFQDAVQGDGGTITLGSNLSIDTQLTLTLNTDATVTLDLNGHSITLSGSTTPFMIEKGTFTLTDSAADSSGVNGAIEFSHDVMTSTVTASATGATQESTSTYTVKTNGYIQGGTAPVFQVTGGTLNIQGGLLCGGTGRAIVQTGGTTNLSGGYIYGFTQSSGSTANADAFGGAIKASGGTLNLSGTVLAGNTAQNGGAIYATGNTSITITGGVISGNTANRVPTNGWNGHSESGAYRCGGGGIYADGTVKITMSGGYVTCNTATDTGYFDGGGGIFLSGTAQMDLSGGYVTGNQAQGGGGIRTDFGKETVFNMTGGFVSGNTATTAEGGGITIDRSGVGTITAGYITNNKIPNTVHWGGGGLFCADGSTLNLKNTLITNNTAGGFGAGVAGCPTGKLYLYVTEGCAIFDNADCVNEDSPHFVNGGAKDGIDAERCTEVFQSNGHADYFCALNSTVTGTMLGGNAANWQGSADQQPVIADAEDVLTATQVMGLTANPTEAGKSAAQSAAKVYINGNYSYTHGGGIMCNGNLVIGVPENVEVPARVELQATKRLVDGSGNTQSLEDNDFSFKVTMTEPDGTVVASGTCDSSGKITFDHQLTFKQAGAFVYYVYEEADAGNPSVTYDATQYRLTMTVTKDSGTAWYGDTIKYTYSLTSIKVESGTDGETWKTVSESSSSQSGIISLPLTSGTTFTNRIIVPAKITVQKKWEGGTGADSVTVILKKDGEESDRQTLNADNDWSYT